MAYQLVRGRTGNMVATPQAPADGISVAQQLSIPRNDGGLPLSLERDSALLLRKCTLVLSTHELVLVVDLKVRLGLDQAPAASAGALAWHSLPGYVRLPLRVPFPTGLPAIPWASHDHICHVMIL